MEKNITLKQIEEIILSKQERSSRYISSMNSLFEEVYNQFKHRYCNNSNDEFNNIIANIAEDIIIPDASFENQNLFLIKKLIMIVLNKELKKYEFYENHCIEDFISIDIEFEPWDDNESWPKLKLIINRDLFTKQYNNWYDSPIFVDEKGVVRLFDTFGDKRFGIDKEYFDKLDSAKLGTYLQDFHYAYDKLSYLCKVIEDNLNYM